MACADGDPRESVQRGSLVLAERPFTGDLLNRTRGSRVTPSFVRPTLTMDNVASPQKLRLCRFKSSGRRLWRITPIGLIDIFAIHTDPSHAVGALFKEIVKFGIRDSSEDSLDCVPEVVTGRVGSIREEPDAGDDDARRDDDGSSDDHAERFSIAAISAAEPPPRSAR